MSEFDFVVSSLVKPTRMLTIILAGAVAVGAYAAGAPTHIDAVRAESPPRIDGRLDDGCWAQARPVTRFLVYRSGVPSSLRTEGRVCYDDRHLYVAVTCFSEKGAELKGTARPHDAGLFHDDHVEVMIDPGKSEENYYQFCANAHGATWDGSRAKAGAVVDKDWDGGWTAKAHRGDGFYSVEIALPFHTLGLTEKTGAVWGLNITRDAKLPAEMSAIAVGGAFNEAGKFAVVRGIEVDFRKYSYEFGPAKLRTRLNNGRREAVLSTVVRNRTGSPQTVRIDIQRRGEPSTPGQPITLTPDERVDIPLETVQWEPLFSSRSDLYIQPRLTTRAVTVTDAATGEVYARSSVGAAMFGAAFQSVVELLRISVADPWQRDLDPVKTPAVEVTVHAVDTEATDCRLAVALTSRRTGKVMAARIIQDRKAVTKLSFATADVPWGAYEVRAILSDAAGRELVSTLTTATVLPGGEHRIRVLNNLVSELMNADERGLLEGKRIEFMNPRHGWCFFRFTGGALVRLNSEKTPLGRGAAEAMRLLPPGRHTLHIAGTLKSLVVRAIPALVYNAHETTPRIRAFGANMWARLGKTILPHCNTIEALREYPEAHDEWKKAGKCWLANQNNPGREGDRDQAAANAYPYWQSSLGYRASGYDGIQSDEFWSSMFSRDAWLALSRSAARLAEDPKFEGRMFIPFACGVYQSAGGYAFMKTLLNAGWPFSEEWYIGERNDEAESMENIRKRLVDSAEGWEYVLPGSVRRMIVTLMHASLPYCTANTSPAVDFKVHLDRQFQTLANDPVFFGLWGVQPYRANYFDPETLLWTGRLMRHYGIKGHTDRLSEDPYVLRHILNSDFDGGTEHWTLEPATKGSIFVDSFPGYGTMQGRYRAAPGQGDRFLVTKRSAEAPNVFSQDIKNLTPGRLYSLRLYTGDHQNLVQGISQPGVVHGISIRIEGDDPLPRGEHGFQDHFSSIRSAGRFNRNHRFWQNFHWRVFRAKKTAAKLVISDWRTPTEPGGPTGQELMFNFIELQPYLEEALELTATPVTSKPVEQTNSAPPKIVVSEGFETLRKDGTPAGWRGGWRNSNHLEAVSVASEGAFRGKNCLHFKLDGKRTRLLQDSPILYEPGKKYTLSAMVKTKGLAMTSRFGILLVNEGWTWTSPHMTFPAGDSDWQRYSVRFKMVAAANKNTQCRVNLYWDGDTGELWVDDITIVTE